MPRRKSAAYMSAGEQIAGTVLFVIYLLVSARRQAPHFRGIPCPGLKAALRAPSARPVPRGRGRIPPCLPGRVLS